MLWRHLCLVRAWSAAGLLTLSSFGSLAIAGEPEEPAPSTASETLRILDAQKGGDLAVVARGNGQERVRLTLKNTSTKRLNVLLPPGLVAASAAGQAPGGRAGGGLQSMGLGTPTNRAGTFGQFRANGAETGLQSVPVTADQSSLTVAVPPGQTVEVTLPSVCLNFGLPSPTYRDQLILKDVDDHSQDPRVRKALRSLATLGTSQGVAQAVMWQVCNNVSFENMLAQNSKMINPREIAIAARFLEALDASNATELVDPAYLTEARVFVRLDGEGTLAKEAYRLSGEIDGLHLMGLPVRLADARELPTATAPALLVSVSLTGSQKGETRGRVNVSQMTLAGSWTPLGKLSFVDGSTVSVLDGPGLAKALDSAIASTFVTVKPARRAVGSTTLRVGNHQPFTLANVILKAGNSSGAAPVSFNGLGVGPGRSALAPIQAPSGVVERIELNGL